MSQVLQCNVLQPQNGPAWNSELIKLESNGLIILHSSFLHNGVRFTTTQPRVARATRTSLGFDLLESGLLLSEMQTNVPF